MEWFPIVFAVVSLVFAVTLGAFILLSECLDCKKRHRFDVDNDIRSTTQEQIPTEPSTLYARPREATQHDQETSSVPTEENDKSVSIMAWSGVTCVYTGKQGQPDVCVLENCYGSLRQGEVTAIMGPSGAGKSTLMNILGGRKSLGTVTGRMSIFGQEVPDMAHAGSLLRDCTAFVPQSLAFFATQTPEEAVSFVATLRHGTNGQDLRWIRKLLEEVGLEDPSQFARPIGGELVGGLTIPGLSGGEKKRLALACALAMKPELLMLDEITSGLDSDNALATMQLVKSVCVKHGVAAVVVIHQPSGYIFETFDQLVLLTRGQCVFSDHRKNLPDLYENVFCKTIPTSNHELPLDVLGALRTFDSDGLKTNGWKSMHSQQSAAVLSTSTTENATPNEQSVSIRVQFSVVFYRNMINHYVRNVTNLVARLLLYVSIAILNGALFWQIGREEEAEYQSFIVGAFAFLFLASYLLPFALISMFTSEKSFVLREREFGLYSPWIYCVCQAVLEFWVITLAATMQTCIVVPMCAIWNLNGDTKFEAFFAILGIFIASGLVGSNLVLLCSIAMPSQELAFLSGSGLVTFALGLSGGFVPFSLMRGFIRWGEWISPVKFSVQALSIQFFEGSPLGEAVLESRELNRPETVTSNVVVLLCINVILVIFTMLALYTKRIKR